MDAVADEFRIERVGGEDCAEDSRLAMIERAHGVESVGGADRSGGNGGAGFGGGGVGMAQGDTDAARRGMRGEFDGAGKLGRERHEAHVAVGGFDEAVESGDAGSEQMFGRLYAAFLVGEKRAFKMDAQSDVRVPVATTWQSGSQGRRARGAWRRAGR